MLHSFVGASLKLSLALSFAASLLLSGCGKSVASGTGKASGTDPDKNKPVPTDFLGNPGAFAGIWQGSCSYTSNGVKNTNCTATLSLKQDAMNSFLMGSIEYTIGYTTSSPTAIRRMEIDGNDLKANGTNVGKIGKNALEFYDSNFGDFSALLFGADNLGVNIAQMPNFTAASCSTSFCFTAALARIQ